jgi:hypothetical protein
VSDDLVQNVDPKISERQHLTISKFLYEFLQISCTVLYKIITARVGCHKFCARWVPKMLMDAHETENGFSLDFLRAIPQRWL